MHARTHHKLTAGRDRAMQAACCQVDVYMRAAGSIETQRCPFTGAAARHGARCVGAGRAG